MDSPEDTNTGPVIRDLRRIDPATGQVRNPGQAGQPQPGAGIRGSAKSRPGRHAVSKPGSAASRAAQGGGGPAAAAAGSAPEATPAGTPGSGPLRPGTPGPGPTGGPASGPPASGAPASGPPASGPPASGAAAAGGPPGGDDRTAAARLAERTADLQRVQAEYANYRKRVERDRVAVREQALASVLSGLVPVLDDIGRAREHGELNGGFKSVAESLEATTAKLGLESFGDAGEPFDPRVHEALMHSYSAEVTEPTCVQILQPGYKVGDRILRPARVAVAEPGADGTGPGSSAGAGPAARDGATPGPPGSRSNAAGNE
jgi:molecular chaperone GrpE